MAKQKRGAKAAAIRELLTANRKMAVSEVVAKLAEKGIKVSRPNVYMIRLKMGAKRRKQIKRKAAAIVGGNGDALAVIRSVRGLADEVGGIGKLKQLVEAIAE
jgi:hypothetical protein